MKRNKSILTTGIILTLIIAIFSWASLSGYSPEPTSMQRDEVINKESTDILKKTDYILMLQKL